MEAWTHGCVGNDVSATPSAQMSCMLMTEGLWQSPNCRNIASPPPLQPRPARSRPPNQGGVAPVHPPLRCPLRCLRRLPIGQVSVAEWVVRPPDAALTTDSRSGGPPSAAKQPRGKGFVPTRVSAQSGPTRSTGRESPLKVSPGWCRVAVRDRRNSLNASPLPAARWRGTRCRRCP